MPISLKAKSRLRPRQLVAKDSESKLNHNLQIFLKSSRISSVKTLLTKSSPLIISRAGQIISRYLKHWPTLALGLILTSSWWWLINRYRPSEIAANHPTYWPVLSLFSLGSFFLASFGWLNTRRGILTSLWLTSLLFFRLQQVILSWPIWLGLTAAVLALELFFGLLQRPN